MLVMGINLARGLRQRCKRRGMKVAALNGNGFDTLFRQPERQLVHLCSYTGGSPLLWWRYFSLSSAVGDGRNDRTANRCNRGIAGSPVLLHGCQIP